MPPPHPQIRARGPLAAVRVLRRESRRTLGQEAARRLIRGGHRRRWKASAMTWTLPEPMLTTPMPGPDLPPGCAAEPKWDGYRAQLARYADGRVGLRSRQGTDMTGAFPEIRSRRPRAAARRHRPGRRAGGVGGRAPRLRAAPAASRPTPRCRRPRGRTDLARPLRRL
ncbi:hypothetical protein AB0L67_39985 [Streptomyces flaveolus]|uniref:ATP-dependent DNA ligase n=1 Tax=Streptomyces flaveolus TaxID=67297 RepID=UPI00343B455A